MQGLRQASEVGRRQPVEERGTIFSPGVKKDDAPAMLDRIGRNLVGCRRVCAAPIGIHHGDGAGNAARRLGQIALPFAVGVAGQTPFDENEALDGRKQRTLGQFAHGRTDEFAAGDLANYGGDGLVVRAAERTTRGFLDVDDVRAGSDGDLGFLRSANADE
jgi:hypothetical protein